MIEELEAMYKRLGELEAQALDEATASPTAERWNAVMCLREAATRVFSASVWLHRSISA